MEKLNNAFIEKCRKCDLFKAGICVRTIENLLTCFEKELKEINKGG